jgi:hypothetical protein
LARARRWLAVNAFIVDHGAGQPARNWDEYATLPNSGVAYCTAVPNWSVAPAMAPSLTTTSKQIKAQPFTGAANNLFFGNVNNQLADF